MEKIYIILALLTGSVLSQNITCNQSLLELVANLTPEYKGEDNSLILNGFFTQDILQSCLTRNFSVELWRTINPANSKVPADFGSREYFSKFQNCDSPNPDLLWKHGDSVHASVNKDNLEISDTWQNQPITFYHVVEREYMVRICPCLDSQVPCTCEHAGQSGAAACSEIMTVSNLDEELVFPWCRGDIQKSPTPLIGVPVLQHCPAKVNYFDDASFEFLCSFFR